MPENLQIHKFLSLCILPFSRFYFKYKCIEQNLSIKTLFRQQNIEKLIEDG
jgi:hypothetical protein